MQEEADLVRAAQAGSHDAFRALVERHRLPVLRTARILLREPALAEDMAQEAWINAWGALAQFDPAIPSVPGCCASSPTAVAWSFGVVTLRRRRSTM